MKKIIIPVIAILLIVNLSFTKKNNKTSSNENWYLCSNCCKTKKASAAPWENGCRSSSSKMHSYQFCGKAGNYNQTCRKCDAEVYLKQGTSPSASRCCASGGTHTWYNK
jgi:uncharacterized protein YxeA